MSQNQKCPILKSVLNSKVSQTQKCPKLKIVPKSKVSQIKVYYKCQLLFLPLKLSPGPATNDLSLLD